ncbi:MAG TPA: gliding motility-associated C-terminal domain-containing protein, partial [Bacteroidia bacterium]|nr:gliding motility-associated C-terminal domain-containing protein [Bacteroidia bacterium]
SAAVPVSCNGGSDGSAVMNATGGSPPFTFSWSPSGGTGQTANGLTAGIYTVTATDTSGCTTTQTVAITQPTAIVVTTTGDTACAGVNGNISVNSSGGIPPYTYLWSDGSTTPSISVSPVTSTTYTITVTDVNGCAVSGTASVFVGPNPVASFTAPAVVNGVFNLSGDPSQLCFTDGSSNAASWYWNFNSQDSAYTQDPCVNVGTSDKGTYCVTLVVHRAIGCVDTTQECIEINDVNYSIPNVFTPNGDGSNDAFIITNSGMASLHCEIYDRWGALIYEWNDPAGYWDGKTNNGKEAVDGVYYYVLYMADYTGKNYNETGFVHLIRGTQK